MSLLSLDFVFLFKSIQITVIDFALILILIIDKYQFSQKAA